MKWFLIALINLCTFNGVFAQDVIVNVNQADSEHLQQVKGIGKRTAQYILEERQRGGPFESLDDLATRVKGIGEKRAHILYKNGLRVETSSDGKQGTLQATSSISVGDKFKVHPHNTSHTFKAKESQNFETGLGKQIRKNQTKHIKPKHLEAKPLKKGEYFLRPPQTAHED